MSWTDANGNPASQSFDSTQEYFDFGSELIPLDALTSGVFINYSTSNSCGTEGGNVLAYTDACFIGAYNVITPDADGAEGSLVQNGQLAGSGINEGWQIIGIDGLANVKVRIYDRWGQLVYESDSYSNAKPWNGEHSNGSDLDDGVYFFTIDTPRTESAFEGTVTIFRKN